MKFHSSFPFARSLHNQASRNVGDYGRYYYLRFPVIYFLRYYYIATSNIYEVEQLNEAIAIIRDQDTPLCRNDAYHLLKECCSKNHVNTGRRVQALMVHAALDSVEVLGNHLIRLFSSGGCLVEASRSFNNILQPTVYTWTAILSAHANREQGTTAIQLYTRITLSGIKCNNYVCLAVIKGCTMASALEQGRFIHHLIREDNIELDVILGSAIVDMYAKSGSLEEACMVFYKLPNRNVVSWNALIAGHTQNGEAHLGLYCFQKMEKEGIKPDKVTFLSLLRACVSMGLLGDGRLVHDRIIKESLESDVMLGNTLIDLYAKCGIMEEAKKVFDNLLHRNTASWNTAISGYVHHGQELLALSLFDIMQHECPEVDKVTLSCILKTCCNLEDMTLGRLIHEQILEHGLQSDVIIGCTLVDMYAKCGTLGESYKAFDKILHRDAVTWGAMIGGCAQNEEALLALEYFVEMQDEGVKPNKVTYSSILKVCGNIGAIGHGRIIHHQILNDGFESDVVVGSSLIDMYAKCGSLEESHKAFKKVANQNVVSWGAMIAGYAQHGKGLFALECFQNMQEKGIRADKLIFLCVLVACSRASLVDEGHWLFVHIREYQGITPDMDHINCLADLLGRTGYLEEGEDLLVATGQDNVLAWTSLLSACKLHGNVRIGRHSYNNVLHLDPSSCTGYVLMSNIYADAQMQDEAKEIEQLRRCAGTLDDTD